MERKLLSLPSFFVLLLIAGIAFLAAPVEDVHAAAPTVTGAEVIDPTGTAAAPTSDTNELTTGGNTNVVVIKLGGANAVQVTGTGDVAAADGFGPEDLKVTVTDTSPGAGSPEYVLKPSQVSVTPIAAETAVPGDGTNESPAANAAGQWFTVGVEVPANGTGTITVQVRAAGTAPAGSSFKELATPNAAYAGAALAPTTGNVVYYDTYNAAPTVTIAKTVSGDAGRDPFEVTFTIADASTAAADQFKSAPTFTTANIDIHNGEVTDVGPVSEETAKTEYEVKALITASEDVDSVIIGVKAGAVTDARGASNVAISATPTGTPPKAPAGALEVMVDLVKPKVVIAPKAADGTALTTATVSVPFMVEFTVTKTTGTPPKETTTVFNRDDLTSEPADDLDVPDTGASDVTVTGGDISDFGPKAGSYKAWTAMVTPDADAEEVVISVIKDAVKTSAGNGNDAYSLPAIPTNYTAPDPTPDPATEPGAIGDPLTGGKKGFTFTLPTITPSADDGSRFVVIAKSADAAMNGVSGTNYPVIDIKDNLWQDIRDFLAYDGGTIDLIGPAGTAVEDLVISEIMWGSDNGLSDPTMSQWIELYNTKTTRGGANGVIAGGTWTIEFISGATSSAATVSDRFSNRQLGQSHWTISDTSGGAYGQSGRTKLTVGVAGQLRDLVSMRRKIDYTKVEKNDHKATGTAANDTANRTEQLNGVPDGTLSGSWEASTSRRNLSGTRKGTPGEKPLAIIARTTVSRNGVVFNEIANRSGATNDWIELHNRGSSDVTINKYELSKVGDNGKDEKLFQFESNEDVVIPGKGYLLVVNTDPSGTNIAEGADVNDPNGEDKGNRGGSSVRYYQTDKLNIPDDKFMLVLRTEPKLGSHEKIADIAGNQFVQNTASATEVWPLRSTRKPVHADALNDLKKDDGKSWVRDFGKALFHHEEWKTSDVKGPGYKRSADTLNSGTPGYPNNAVQGEVKSDGLTNANPVVISEIMFGAGDRRALPQWIELYNPSTTQTVNLENWTLEIQNTKSPDEELRTATNATLKLKKILVHPNQTVLIVSTHGSTSKSEHFPSSRVYNLWNNHKEDLDMSSRRDAVLSSIGFYLSISDPKDKLVDEVGNLDGNKRTNDDPDWVLPGGNLDDGGRASMIRREATFGDGTEADSWISAGIAEGGLQKVGINDLYYGDEDDLGTPGYRAGGPLPVQLSSFYSKRNAAGAVVITWSTESELDNAGFNILRSQSRTGEFVRINAQLIPGAGTTGEKTAYTWTDTSAKPNVLYFYQIEDVSLAGDHRTLQTTRLRGYIGAAGKATTTWGDLKSRE